MLLLLGIWWIAMPSCLNVITSKIEEKAFSLMSHSDRRRVARTRRELRWWRRPRRFSQAEGVDIHITYFSFNNIAHLYRRTFSVGSFHDKPFLGSNGAIIIKTVYRLAVKDRQGQTWHTEKRYSDFRSLHEQATSLGLMNDHDDHCSFPSKA